MRVLTALAFMAMMVLTACSAPAARISKQAATGQSAQVAALAAALQNLSPGIEPEEAARAARVSYTHVARLRQEYEITDSAIVHNIKVNRGTRPRGLCWHWAEDMETRLAAEGFQSLQLHRAIANYDNWRLEHSTVIISAAGASMYDGIVIDPWRKGGELTWMPVRDDRRYNWTPRDAVFDWKRERGLLTTRYVVAAGG